VGILRRALAGSVLGCVFACGPKPVEPRHVSPLSGFLSGGPAEVSGDLHHVKHATWCAPDGALSIPAVPFPDGPTLIQDAYGDGGVTCTLAMFDAHDSVVQIVRTRIREDLPAEHVLSDKVVPSLERAHHSMPEVRWEWIVQSGRRQIQSVNLAPDYHGRESAMLLSLGQGVAQRQDSCRVDRHFVAAGYYFQIIALAFHATTLEPCRVAEELAGWSAAHLRAGEGCPDG
jgi:hypothetical protein